MPKLYKVVFTPRAERQLADLYAYVADHSDEARAARFVGGIVDDCLSLREFPSRGTRRDDVRPHLRTMGHKRRVTIAFSVHTDTLIVAVHGVFYGGQDYVSLLRESDA